MHRRCASRPCPLRRSQATWPAESRWARRGPMRSRARPPPGSSESAEVTPVSWVCPSTKPRCCCVDSACASEQPTGMQDILINWSPQETRVAIVENGAVQELHIERTLERGLVGNIYSGRVARVLPGMQSAFVDIGLERAAFLHVADLHVNGRGNHAGDNGISQAAPAPIERLVFEGQALTVQVIKDPIGTKGARLSTQISIAGRLL